ncbi:Ectoine hydroxylase-related dioxygenase, phytanoyl-CoA dioxygenase (PhyH) family [Geosmithia morbida]|uniref:Ectoine hydroxylase-related dioxygenase, phytanoyl-CoA dioxygenase (PhyH) family n=1 Tax=Geosmithia morbida TaxID=1094350 RepID=A0A9P4YV15_9HYPO|nr:Ectoine hydroxylase-related dioxygenase, phytanoyl-CoA dioxygenase (PhyH) family [Geosmithia morbida]KAF4122203.1 Ectoine hydroxylase-related dioxygenase, phytanoyl-CoA dioxygenase (PhyH) family [Geosmithia morbida]
MPSRRLFSASSPPSVDSFASLCSRQPRAGEYPLAASIEDKVPVYSLPPYGSLSDPDREALQDEWYGVMKDGPGVLVLRNMYRDADLIDRVSGVYRSIVDGERRSNASAGDHFAAKGTNDRVWNSLSKHAAADPPSFVDYYANPYLGLVCEAWLGPGYRVTAQMNSVKPGGAPQECHRDYHIGFQTAQAAARYPRAAHLASQFLTLQGAVAHVDVPVVSGPTRLLPYSQTLDEGYMAYRLPAFRDYFADNYVSLPLSKGDGLFFNPALFHAAGSNRSADIDRMVNLLQISSGFGRPMETVETVPIVRACWEGILAMYRRQQERGSGDGGGDEENKDGNTAEALVRAVADGYPFPTNLDRNAPGPDEMTPPSEQKILRACLEEGCDTAETVRRLVELGDKSRA